MIVVVYVICLLVISFFWAFMIVPYFHDMLPLNIFFLVFFFLSVFVGVAATHLANRYFGQEDEWEVSTQETLLRRIIGYTGVGLMALLAIVVLWVLGGIT